MGRKRPFKYVGSDDDSDSDIQYDDYHQFAEEEDSDSDMEITKDTEDDLSSDSADVNNALHQLYLKERKKLKKLKSKLCPSLKHKDKKAISENNVKDAFTRFSVSYFSSVIEALSDDRKKIIENYGFGSLLRFDKCFVPNKFAQWVFRQIDHKTGDIVVKHTIIPFTRESVHYVLGLPLGSKPFPKDYSTGKAILLSEFGLSSVPTVKYFGNKLLKNEEMSDEQVFMCFILVAMNCFLCPNASLPPASKYLGIKDKDPPTLCGCLYLIAVYYLDFVDFGQRQVPSGLPRILYWKRNMITNFSMLDQVSAGVYGFRPLMDISRTCYSKQSVFLHMNPAGLASNSEFLQALDSSSGCELPRELKYAICDHAYSVDARTQSMVLKLLKIISEAASANEDEEQVKTTDDNSHHVSTSSIEKTQVPDQVAADTNTFITPMKQQIVTPASQKAPGTLPNVQSSSKLHKLIAKASDQQNSPASAKKLASKIREKLIQQDIEKVMDKLHKTNHESPDCKTTCVTPVPEIKAPNIQCNSGFVSKRPFSKIEIINNYVTETEISKLRDPYCDISDDEYDERVMRSKKSVTFVRENGERDVIYLDNPKENAADPFSAGSQRGPMRYIFRKRSQDDIYDPDENSDSPQTPMTMRSLPDSPLSLNQVTPHLTQPTINSASKKMSVSGNLPTNNESKGSPECVITGQKNLFQKTTEMTKKADDLYNSKLNFGQGSSKRPFGATVCSNGKNDVEQLSDADDEDVSELKPNKSTTGGKMPRYGPRRTIQPVYQRPTHVAVARDRFRVSESERKNYRAICRLASSKFKDDYAVDIGGVHCTFRSFGESLMPGGVMSNFVVAVFCRHLFMKNHPDVSKKHYFFSNIADQLLKHPEDAVKSVLQRAFTRSTKARPLEDSNLLFFPVLFEHYWFVFVVDIKDHYFVFLDSFYSQEDPYQQHVRDRLIASFIYHWHQFVRCNREMNFEEYHIIYPAVPKQGEDNMVDCGIFILMFLENWNSPRSVLTSIFDVNDVPKIRIKIANELMFLPTNNGFKRRVLEFIEQDTD
ncbi:hypothetical protein ACP70R_040147 [Stipagrostis hirtigluma subsp. patula]